MDLSVTALVGAVAILAGCVVFGFAGFGIALVSLAVLAHVMPPATAVVLLTIYAMVFAVVIFAPLRREARWREVAMLLVGTVLGTPLGVWALATLPAPALRRLIGLVLVAIAALEFGGRFTVRLSGRGWGLSAGLLAGALGGAVGTPGPPVVVYATAQGWPPRAVKANLQAFFVVNEAVILAGYWWAGLLTPEIGRLALLYALPALAGVLTGIALFHRIDPPTFRRIVFALLLLSGLVLLIRG